MKIKSEIKKQFGNIDFEGFFINGSVTAQDWLGAGFDNCHCIICNSPLKYVVMTNHGTMGGDCYATLTGDNKTRAYARKIKNNLNKAFSWYNIEFIQIEKQIAAKYTKGIQEVVEYKYIIKAKYSPEYNYQNGKTYYKSFYIAFPKNDKELAIALSALEEINNININKIGFEN